MHLAGMSTWQCLLLGAAGGVSIGIVTAAWEEISRRLWPERQEPKHRVQLFDEHGIPIKTHSLSGKGMAELIRHIDAEWYR